ncbi:single-stranded-DNA-specific exonuclease RecJ [Arcobacter sp. FWKO B]|uniref:single-stranded-DNA-specific exonuclease RecJ n=1 Tax=Arcobacter sp. FWKO B TaxID=2593672 RepID=UPI0018A5C7B4|nr:single-stranded-DNA-specific exonuclease RecJ [Arcobacter sp. FWKO B]QOG12064.1 single-stranded-DNA-specific exonuclease RecJ [Arcobacter sp. FWKO B]
MVLSKDKLYQILSSRVLTDSYNSLKTLPSPALFKDIQKGAKRVVEAITKGEKIAVVGDYDVDGIVSTAIMVEFFDILQYPISYIIPNRFVHGYGLSAKIIDQLDSDTKVVITVDNGISAIEAARICKNRGIDLIITDHHTPPQILPVAYAIINPKQDECTFPYQHICGAQVAWYFCAALKSELGVEINMADFLDILSIAIIADIMPMRGLNFAMTKKGLEYIARSKRVALQEFVSMCNKTKINGEDIGFLLAPLLNSAGRLDDPKLSLDFLLSKNRFEANQNLYKLIDLNNQRKELQLQIYQEALDLVDIKDDVIVVYHPLWNEGILGIVASKLCDKFKKPSFVLTKKEDTIKGSARSSGMIDLYELLRLSSDTLEGFGGHKSAAGVSLKVENLGKFKQALNQNISNLVPDTDIKSDYLGELLLDEVDFELFEIIEQFEPYGLENEKPHFLFKDVKIQKVQSIGKNKEHTKFLLNSTKSDTFEALLFGENATNYCEMDYCSFIATLGLNEFRGNISLNLHIKEIL